MNTSISSRAAAGRLPALLASGAVTALLLGGQLLLAGHYTAAAEQKVARERGSAQVAKAAGAAPQRQKL